MESSGARLKRIRLEKGLSLEDVQKKTKMHLNVLNAIEGDSISDLSPIYLRSFIKLYCNFLGVDPKDYLSEVKQASVVKPSVKQAPAKHADSGKESSILKNVSQTLGTLGKNKANKKIIIYVLSAIVLSIGLFNCGKWITAKRSQKQVAAPVVAERKTKPVKTTAVSAKATQEIKYQKESLQGIKLVIIARDNCFVSTKVDGRTVFQRILEKGRSKTWQANKKIELSLGNAGAVELQINGQRFPSLGKKNQALKGIVITGQGMNIPR